MRRTCDGSVAQTLLGLVLLVSALSATQLGGSPVAAQERATIEYRVLATNKTSTMERELNEATEAGYPISDRHGGRNLVWWQRGRVVVCHGQAARESPVCVQAARDVENVHDADGITAAADAGFHYRGQTVFETALGGNEVVVILERDKDAATQALEFKLMATPRLEPFRKSSRSGGQWIRNRRHDRLQNLSRRERMVTITAAHENP